MFSSDLAMQPRRVLNPNGLAQIRQYSCYIQVQPLWSPLLSSERAGLSSFSFYFFVQATPGILWVEEYHLGC